MDGSLDRRPLSERLGEITGAVLAALSGNDGRRAIVNAAFGFAAMIGALLALAAVVAIVAGIVVEARWIAGLIP